MGHPDFRVGGKVFATLDYPSAGWATVMLTPYDQEHLVRAHPAGFRPVKGKWGEGGATNVLLKSAPRAAVSLALRAAHEKALANARKKR
jgi:hypothetical protein